MTIDQLATASRRSFLTSAVIGAGMLVAAARPGAAVARDVLAPSPIAPQSIRPALFAQAREALLAHAGAVPMRDRIAIADFAAPSGQPRFHLVDMASGDCATVLVAHGRGSDPEHTGWLQRFSNDPGSFASCHGAFLAADFYVGKHGRSQRLIGLDPTNDKALARDIVIHSADYASASVATARGRLGRSEGCFAVDPRDLDLVLALLGPGRMLFAAKT